MKVLRIHPHRVAKAQSALTLVEVLVAVAMSALSIGGIVYGYTMSAQRAEWSAYNLAAHSLAMQQSEMCRAAKWDPVQYPPVDNLVSSNFPVRQEVLDIPIIGTNIVYATNRTTITLISSNPQLKMVDVECTWSFMGRGVFTNRVVTYRSPDQ